ncbi:uncharacterized protein N7503_002253 [Penicillium pulvis]|uniref:uncharacterized protein n=1 Tax=Penicillium pulvis TaxID=1562058 RepID=UPI002546DA66|nr:uncharacterized protein N7503_002253 [Penicillium pulvis]KAJ5810035.1 hypothetical protein N7503_002253 [Penicillium pulvis]
MASDSPYRISATDRSGLIVIVETLFMSWMIIVGLIRLYMRIAINGPVQIDDLALFVGSGLGVAHVGTIMDAVNHGLGRPQDESSVSSLKKAGEGLYAANLLFLAAHGASKISICLLLKRLGRQDKYLLSSKILLAVVAAWTVASFLAIALSCHPENLLIESAMAQECGNLNLAWKTITAFDVITEVLSFGLSIFLVWGIQMRWKEKATVIFAFGTRTPTIILIILRQAYLDDALYHPNPSLLLSKATIATAVLIHCSLMVSTVPCLKPFVIAFNTGWGQGVTNSYGESSYFTPTGNSGSTNHSRVYTTNPGDADEDDAIEGGRDSQESQHSRQLIIHQTQEWIVQEEYEMQVVRNRI